MTKVANNIKEEGARQYGTKLKTYVSAGDKALDVMSSEQAMANECVQFVLKHAGKARVEALCRQVNAGPTSNKKTVDLRTMLAEKLFKLKAPRVLKLLTSEEHNICDKNLSSRKLDKVILAKNSRVDIRQVYNDSQYKLTGAEANMLCFVVVQFRIPPQEYTCSEP